MKKIDSKTKKKILEEISNQPERRKEILESYDIPRRTYYNWLNEKSVPVVPVVPVESVPVVPVESVPVVPVVPVESVPVVPVVPVESVPVVPKIDESKQTHLSAIIKVNALPEGAGALPNNTWDKIEKKEK
jgi:hypothetical protein